MNKLYIIGNLTRDPEMRTTATGKSVCSFTVAVNKRGKDEADFFKVSAWNQKGEVCGKYLKKGSKVCVIGPVSGRPYTNNNGEAQCSLEVDADEVEFLSPKSDGFTRVDVDDNPFA